MSVRSFANGGNPTRRSPLSDHAGWPSTTEDPQAGYAAQRGLGSILPAAESVTTAAKLPADEFTRFEQQAAKEFPDLNVTVGIANTRKGLGWEGRTYVLRASGQPIGAAKLEAKAASIELAIRSMIGKVATERARKTAERMEAQLARRAA